MNSRWLKVKQLDRQVGEWQSISQKHPRPRSGWVKTIREALNMSTVQLANRLGVTRARVAKIENAEIQDATTLRTLREVAAAMDCEFVYALVPKQGSSLESIIKNRAHQIADERVSNVAQSMALESQSLSSSILKNQKHQLEEDLMRQLNKKLWTANDIQEKSIKKKNNLFKKLREKMDKKK